MLRKSILVLLALQLVAVSAFTQTASASLASSVPEWVYDSAQWVYDGCIDVPRSILGDSSGSLAMASGVGTGGYAWGTREWANAQTWQQWKSGAPVGLTGPIGQTAGRAAIPIATAGAASSTAVAVPAGTAVATTSTGTITGSAAALPAGSAVAAAVVGVGALCATINLHHWVFGEDSINFDPSIPVQTTGLVDCATSGLPSGRIEGHQPGDKCATFDTSASGPNPDFYLRPVREGSTHLPERLKDGSIFGPHILNMTRGTWGAEVPPELRREWIPEIGGGTLVLPCASPEFLCGLTDWNTLPPTTPYRADVVVQRTGGAGSGSSIYQHPIDWAALEAAKFRRLLGVTTCMNPGTGAEQIIQNTSPVFTDGGDTPEWTAPHCPAGEAPIKSDVLRQTAEGGATAPATFTGGQIVRSWTLPTTTKNNPTTLACLAVGATSCDRVPDPENPDNVRIGGPLGLSVPSSDPGTLEVIEGWLGETPWPAEEPEGWPDGGPDPDPDPGPDPNPDPDETGGADPRSGGTPGTAAEVPGGDPDGCWPTGWGWLNPIEWVLNPIKCALMWAFWDADAADEMGELLEENGWSALATDSSITTDPAAGPCIDMDVAEICTEPIFAVTAPGYVSALVAAVVSFFTLFEVIGLFVRITGG